MDNSSLVVLFLAAVCGVMFLLGLALCATIREMARQILETSKLILLAWKSAEGDLIAGRGLVAKAMQPSTPASKPKKADGVAPPKTDTKPPFTMRMGSI